MNDLQSELALLKQQYDAERLRILDKYLGAMAAPVAPTLAPVKGPVAKSGINRKYSAEEVEQALAQVIDRIRTGGPAGREGLRSALNMENKLLSKALFLGTDSDQLAIVGERRAAKYVIPSTGQREGRVKKRTSK